MFLANNWVRQGGLLRERTWIPWLLAFSFCSPAFAIDQGRRLDQLHHTAWKSKDGAPTGITALAQTSDGYLWIGTGNDLVRFDGVRFVSFKPVDGAELPGKSIKTLFSLPDGGLWIGFLTGQAALLRHGRLTIHGVKEGLADLPLLAFARDHKGRMWAAQNSAGIFRLEGARWRKVESPGINPLTLFVDSRGTLWVGSSRTLAYLPEGEEQFHIAESLLRQVFSIAQAPGGTVWLSDFNNGIRTVSTSVGGDTPEPGRPVIKVGSLSMLFDRQGSLWIAGRGKGLWRVPHPGELSGSNIGADDPQVETFTQKDGLSSDSATCLIEDREGDLWVGTYGGLDRFRQTALVPLAVPSGALDFLLTPNSADGGIQLAAANQHLMQVKDGRVSMVSGNLVAYEGFRFAQGFGLVQHYVDDPSGRLSRLAARSVIEGTFHHPRMYNRGHLHAYPEIYLTTLGTLEEATRGSATGLVTFTRDASGRPWFSIPGEGVFRPEPEPKGFTSLEMLGGPKINANSSFTDSKGNVWFGFRDNTAAVLEGDKIRTFTGKDGISVGTVRAIHEHDSMIWLGGDGGVQLFEGSRFVPVKPAVEHDFDGTRVILGSDRKGLWVGANRGVIRVSETEIEAIRKDTQHPVIIQVFGPAEGLPSNLQSRGDRTSARGADGRLYFATNEGVIWVDPGTIPVNRLPPPVSIESVIANGVEHALPTPVQLPPRTTSLQIRYTALSLSVPEKVRFRYKLDGSDGSWQDAQTRRDAFYTNLGPGSYTFHVIACNGDGVWNETGAALQFEIAPAFYQTWWFRLIYVALAAGALWMLYLYRLQRATLQVQERMGARLEERERIARELHDTLLQGFQGLMLRFQAVMKTLPNEGPARPMMETVMERADQILLEGRQSVRDLREQGTTGDELSQALSHCGAELAQDRTASFSMTLVGTPRALDAIVFTETYRVAREALINAFQHAHAGNIEVELTYHDKGLCLRVRDDGAGIDPQVLSKGRDGHWGLSGMRERAQKIGAEFRILSSSGAGTEIELNIPAHIAFPGHRKKSLWQRFISGVRIH